MCVLVLVGETRYIVFGRKRTTRYCIGTVRPSIMKKVYTLLTSRLVGTSDDPGKRFPEVQESKLGVLSVIVISSFTIYDSLLDSINRSLCRSTYIKTKF